MVETFTVTVFHAELAAIASEFGEDFFHDRLRTPKVNAIRFLFENGFYARKARVTVKFTNPGNSSISRILGRVYECTYAEKYDWAENEEIEIEQDEEEEFKSEIKDLKENLKTTKKEEDSIVGKITNIFNKPKETKVNKEVTKEPNEVKEEKPKESFGNRIKSFIEEL